MTFLYLQIVQVKLEHEKAISQLKKVYEQERELCAKNVRVRHGDLVSPDVG